MSYEEIFLNIDNEGAFTSSYGCSAGHPEAGIKLRLRTFKRTEAEAYSIDSKSPSIGSITFLSGAQITRFYPIFLSFTQLGQKI
jgi:hypothetical protein